MKIAIVYPSFYGVGGIARYLESFVSNIPDSVEEITLITSGYNKKRKEFKNLKIIHVDCPENRLGFLFWTIRVRKLLKKMYKSGEIECVNFHFPPMIAGLFLPKEIPLILTVHSTYLGMAGKVTNSNYFKIDINPLSLWIKVFLEKFLLKKSRQVITLNDKGVSELKYYGYENPITVIPNGVDVELFESSLGLSKEFDVIFCGRIEKMKGSRPMVEICKALVILRPNIKICIVGYGEDQGYVKHKLSGLSQVQLVGKVPFEQVSVFYSKSRVYASSSYYEGLPGTCLEAMAMGLPAVGWDLPFYKGVVRPGENGELVAVNDVQKFCASICELLDNESLREDIGLCARLHIERNYDWKLLAKEMIEAFERGSK